MATQINGALMEYAVTEVDEHPDEMIYGLYRGPGGLPGAIGPLYALDVTDRSLWDVPSRSKLEEATQELRDNGPSPPNDNGDRSRYVKEVVAWANGKYGTY